MSATRVSCSAHRLGVLLALGALVLPSLATAQTDEAFIKYRQKVMSGIGDDMGAVSDILKNGLPLRGQIAIHAAKLEMSADLIGPAFEKRVVDGATDAKATIWEDAAKFQEAIQDYRSAAEALRKAAESDSPAALGPAVKKLGGACGGCHKPFRKPKEDSYKRAQ